MEATKSDQPNNNPSLSDPPKNDLLTQKLKSMNLSQLYIKGSYLDVYDAADSVWRVAKVIDLNQNYVKITYDGWKSVYDDTIALTSQKLSPFRSKTMNYTGHKVYPRDGVFSNLKADIEQTIERMQNYGSKKFTVDDPYELTQFLRGHLYILLDYCLSKSQHQCDSNYIRTFLEMYISFFNEYLEVFQANLKEALEFRNINPLIYLVHDKSALVNSFPEMLDSLRKLFGHYERLTKFFQGETEFKISGEIFVKKSKNPLQNQNLFFINMFIASGGYQRIMNLVDWSHSEFSEKTMKKSNNMNKSENNINFPFFFIRETYSIHKLIIPYLISPKKENVTKELMMKFGRRINIINSKDIKDMDLKDTLYTVQRFNAFFEELNSKEINQFDTEEREMVLVVKFIKSGFLEKQLKAIDEIKKLILISDPSNEYSEDNDNYSSKRNIFAQPDKLRSFIIKSKLIEYILGEEFHVEILKRAKLVFKFLAQSGGISKDHFDLLWKLSGDIHENNKKTVFETLIELSRYLNSDNLDYIYEKLRNIPVEKFDETSIELLKEFIISSLRNKSLNSTFSNIFSKVKNIFGDSKLDSPAFTLLWRMMLDDSKLEPNYTKTCINAIIDIFKRVSSKSEKEKYLEMCIDYLKRGVSICQSLILFMSISGTISSSGLNYFLKDSALDDVIAKWNKNYNLIDLVIRNLEKYLMEFQRNYTSPKFPAERKFNYQNYVYEGKYTYRENLETRLNFITNISINSTKKNELTLEHLKKLWSCLIKNKLGGFEQTLFINWLLREKADKDKQNKKTYCLPDTLINEMFNKIFIDPNFVDVPTMTYEVFKCFQSFFEYINIQQKIIEINHRGQFRIMKFNSILGKEYFWHIMTFNQNEQILNICKTCLLNIYIRLSNDVYKPEDRLSIWKEFINCSIENITNKEIKPFNLNYAAMTLKTFLNILDGHRYQLFDNPSSISFSVAVKLAGSEPQKKLIQLPSNSTFVFLRKKITDSFNLQFWDFEMGLYKNGTTLSPDNEEDYSVSALEQFRDKEPDIDIIVNVNKKKPSKFALVTTLKSEISNGDSIIEVLFGLLSNANQNTGDAVWELIKFLPVNVKVRNDIVELKLDGSDEKSWLAFLDFHNARKCLYSLEIIDDIMSENLEADWISKFGEKGGFNYLYLVFMTFFSSENLSEKLNCKLIAITIKLLLLFMKTKLDKSLILAQDFLQKLCSKCLEFLFKGTSITIKNSNETKLPEEFTNNLLDFILLTVSLDSSAVTLIMNMPNLSLFIYNVFFELLDLSFQKTIKDKLLLICECSEKKDSKNNLLTGNNIPLNCFLFSLCVNEFILKLDLLQFRDRCFHFFDFLNFLGLNVREGQTEILSNMIDFSNLFKFLLDLFANLPIYEKNQGESDYLLQGVLKIFQIILRFLPNFKEDLLNNSIFMKEFSYHCLFEMPSMQIGSKEIPPPKCKNLETRSLAFDLLRSLISNTNCDISFVLTGLKELFLNALWRSGSSFDWNLTTVDSDKSRTGYVGLRNLGSTCYMNSLFQQFFMIQDFREALLQVKNVDEGENSMLYHFQLILEALKSSQKPYYDTRQFCGTYKTNEGSPLNVVEQMDVDEFFNNFLERLEIQLKGTRYEKIIQKTFGGVLSNELIGKDPKECSHYREKEELFLSVSLQVKNKKSIQNSLENFIQGELLEGPNAYFCEKCAKKVKTLKRVCIKRLPNMLILVLKRFEFNYETMTKIKLNDFCEFPLELDMTPFTQDYLKDPEGDKPFAPEYYNYNLKGVVIHMGTADSGHYYSLINDTTKKQAEWFEFNDTCIKKFDINNLAFEAFGGEDKSLMEYSQIVREKSHNAYLLFYQRKTMFDDSGNEIDSLMQNSEFTDPGSECLEFIKADNLKYHINKILLDHSLEMFFFQIGLEFSKLEQLNGNSLGLSKMILYNFLIVGLRAKDRDKLPKNLRMIKDLLAKSYELSDWLISQISFVEIIKEFLIECAIEDMRYIFVGVLRMAFAKVNERDDGLAFDDFVKSSSLAVFIVSCFGAIMETKNTWTDLLKSLHFLAKISNNSRKFIKANKILTFLKEFLLEEPFTQNLIVPLKNYEMQCELKPIMFPKIMPPNQKANAANMQKLSIDRQAKEFNYLGLLASDLILNNEYERNELETILTNEDILRKMLRLSRKKMVFVPVSKILCFYAKDNIDYSKKLLELAFVELYRCEEFEMKIYWILCEELLKIDDEFKEERVKMFIELFISFFEKNLVFYKSTEISFNYLIKITGRNSAVLKAFSQYFDQNTEKYAMIERWLTETKDIYFALESKRNFQILRKKQEGVYAYSFYLNSDKQKRKTEKRLKRLRKIQNNLEENLMLSVDSDEDFSSNFLKVGDTVDYLFIKTYHSCKIEDSMEDMYKIKNVEPNVNFNRWIYFDDENIYQFKKMQDYMEDYFDYYK